MERVFTWFVVTKFVVGVLIGTLVGTSIFMDMPAQAEPFKLSAQTGTSTYEPSNIGIIGLRYLHRPGSTSEVVEIYPQTPASRSDIRIGDKIVAVDGINVAPYDVNGVHQLISGSPGTQVTLRMMRCSYSCQTYNTLLTRMDRNQIASDSIFNIYRFGL